MSQVTWMELAKAALFVGKEVAVLANEKAKEKTQKALLYAHNKANKIDEPSSSTIKSAASKVLNLK